MEKTREKKKRAIQRDKAEFRASKAEENRMQMVKIFPLLKHKDEFFIDEKFDSEYRKLKKEIETKKAAALAAAGGDRKKMDFDVRRDVYFPDVKEFVFDLKVEKTNARGEKIVQPEKTAEELAEIEFKN